MLNILYENIQSSHQFSCSTMKFKIFFLILFLLNNLIESSADELLEKTAKYRCKLIGCQYFRPSTDNEKYSDSINNFMNSTTPNGYIARFSFYIAEPEPGRASVVLSKRTNFYESNGSYKFEIAGLGQTLYIYKDGNSLVTKSNYQTFPPEAVLKVLIEITELGYLNVYFNDNPEPMVSVFDAKPNDVKYIALGQSYGPIQYFFNCPSDANETSAPAPNPTFAPFDDNDLSSAPIHVLAEKCKVNVCWGQYEEPTPFDHIAHSQSNGYLFRLPFYMLQHSRILLSKYYRYEVSGYTIEIDRNQQVASLYRQNNDYAIRLIQEVPLPNLNGTQIKVIVQISTNGLIEVFLGDLYKQVLSYVDDNLIQVNRLQFGGEYSSRTLYFYECSDFGESSKEHVLLDNFKSKTEDLKQKCGTIETKDNDFPEYLNISEVGNVNEEGYRIRLPIYVQAEADAFILLTTKGVEDKIEAYEFSIGAYNNKIATIRKNDQVLATVEMAGILVQNKPVKLVIEITNAGVIRVYTEHNRSVPLLEVEDKNPINELTYISYYAYDENVIFFYKCST